MHKKWDITIVPKQDDHLKLVMQKYNRGKSSPAFWANKFLWAGPRGHKKMPPKSQKFTRGLKKENDEY